MFKFVKIKEKILHVFPYGSRVYGTHTENSDYDYIVVVEGEEELEYGIHEDNYNVTVYSDVTFRKLIKEHHIAALECIFSNKTEYEFVLDYEQLRRSISAIASNSFVKCKKKLMPGPDFNPYVGKKSMFHSIRILDEGIQIGEYGRIVDFSASNYLLPIIMEMNNWEEIKDYCQPIANEKKSKFKKVAPLDKDINNKKW